MSSKVTPKNSRSKLSSRSPNAAIRSPTSQQRLYEWRKRYSVPEPERLETQSQSSEIRKLKAELRRVTEERDIL